MDERVYYVVCRGVDPGDPIDWLALDGLAQSSFGQIEGYIGEQGLSYCWPRLERTPEGLEDALFLIVESDEWEDGFQVWMLTERVLRPEEELGVLKAITEVEDTWYYWLDSLEDQDH